MASLKAKDIKISFVLDDFTWGDMEDIQSQNLIKLLDVCCRLGEIEGKEKEDVRAVLRQLHRDEIFKIIDLLTEAMRNQTNPVDDAEKN